MITEFSIEELVELRLDLTYTAQKVERLVMARLSNKHREKHTWHYSAEDLNSAKKELESAQIMLHGAAEKLSPTILALAQEGVPV